MDCIKGEIIFEDLACLEHEQWSKWMKYLFSKSQLNEDGTVTIPKDLVDRWNRQINTHYSDLSESEKESDREQAKYVMDIIRYYKEKDLKEHGMTF